MLLLAGSTVPPRDVWSRPHAREAGDLPAPLVLLEAARQIAQRQHRHRAVRARFCPVRPARQHLLVHLRAATPEGWSKIMRIARFRERRFELYLGHFNVRERWPKQKASHKWLAFKCLSIAGGGFEPPTSGL